jgi:predicted deacylase
MSKPIIINNIIIHEGMHLMVNMSSYRLPTRTIIDIPAYVYRAKEEGPVVLFLAGMHGDETNGIEIVRRLITEKHFLNLKRGSVIAIPVINIVSFLNHMRELPDGKDLNRCFPGSKNGSFGAQIAADLMREIIPQIDFGVDFHTGGKQINNYPQIRCAFEDPKSVELALQFGAPFVINSPYRDKTLRKEASKHNKSILVYEAGESYRFNRLAVEEGIYGCLRFLYNLQMMDMNLVEQNSIILHRSTWVRAKAPGLFWSQYRYGAKVEKGELIATINDPYGEHQTHLISPEDGYIIGLNNQPVVNSGDALFHIGSERKK